MKANELRIGNLVLLTKDNFKTTKEYQLSGVDIYKLEESDCEDVKPIPLTEEWLLKFGFEEDNVWVHKTKNISHNRMIGIDLPNNHVFLSQCDHHKHFRDVFIIKCDHVHQLQNIYFSLTGEELTIK